MAQNLIRSSLHLDHGDLLPGDDRLSNDPVNCLLAVEAARSGLEKGVLLIQKMFLEFNASSGTPVMKSSWSILQAAGYVPHSNVWQIRNPKEMGSGIGSESLRLMWEHCGKSLI
jgi:hypothetical protein